MIQMIHPHLSYMREQEKFIFGLRVEVFETPLTPGLAPEDTDKFLHYDSLAQSRKTREMNWRD